MALAAVWPVDVFWDEAVAVADRATLVPLPPVTVTTIVSAGLETVPSLTVRLKVRLVAALGAVKVGLTAVVLERLTAGPAVWLQA